jgi:predicted AAA+ superfamily ATPase
MDDDLISRRALATALESVGAFRSTLIQGARQVGKSTMASQLGDHVGARTITL